MERSRSSDKMSRIGIITIPKDRIYREDYQLMTRGDISLTEAFFDRVRRCTYKQGNDAILSMNDDTNLLLGHFDNDAIMLYSENSVLSPREFINCMINLQNCCTEMRSLISRQIGFSDFGLQNLNINFAEIELATNMDPIATEKYIKNFESSPLLGSNARIGIEYNTGRSTIKHRHVSQYGTNLMGFIDHMIRTNPEIRLLMSNVVCTQRPLDIRRILEEAIGEEFDFIHYRREGKISEKVYKDLMEGMDDRTNERFLKSLKATEKKYKDQRKRNNQKYDVYPALKYVVESIGEKKDIDQKYLLEWYEGDSDVGEIAIKYALNNMLLTIMREDEGNMRAPRNLIEVKAYMEYLDSKAHEMSKGRNDGTKKIPDMMKE